LRDKANNLIAEIAERLGSLRAKYLAAPQAVAGSVY
jgi:hypothetical protein